MKLRVLLTLAAMISTAVWVSAAQPPAEPQGGIPPVVRKLMEMLEEGEPAFTEKELAPLVKKLTPLVEKATGRQFKTPAKIKLADRKEVARSLVKELTPQLQRLMKGPQGRRTAHAQAAMQASIFATCMLGKYGAADQTLYLLPRNFPPLLKLAKTDPKHTMSIVQLTLAHELTHCMQDQHIGLGKAIARLADVEAMQAFNAVMEGQAVFVQDLVGRQLGLDDAVLETARLFSAGAVELDDPALAMLGKQMAAQFEQIYLGGRDFVAYHHKRGGMERVWQILAQPPADTSMISKPATYSAKRKAEIDYQKILTGLEKQCAKRTWTTMNIRVGEMMLRAQYAQIEPKAREEILAKVARVQNFGAHQLTATPPAMLNVSLIVLKDPAFAPRMTELLLQTAKANVEKLKASPMMKVSDFKAERFAGAPADATVASRLSFTVSVGPQAMSNTFVRIGRGDILIEIHHLNAGLDDKKVAAMAELIYTRYQQAKQRAPQRAPQPAPPARRRKAG